MEEMVICNKLDLINIANTIRSKTGGTTLLRLDQMAIEINNLKTYEGETYTGDATLLYIEIASEGRMTVPIVFSQSVTNGVTVDWGDGSESETFSGTTASIHTHVYSAVGEYIISLLPQDDCTLKLGGNSSNYCVMGTTVNTNSVYCSMLKKVNIGKNVTKIDSYTFKYCYSLSSITISSEVTSIGDFAFQQCVALPKVTLPSGITSIGKSAFYNCYSLLKIEIPSGVQSISDSTFYSCYSLFNVVIPSSVTGIGNDAFYYCRALSNIVVPETVTSLGTRAFYTCQSLPGVAIPPSITTIGSQLFYACTCAKFYDFSNHMSVPTLSNTNAFTNIPSDCEIRVPSSLVDEWKAATNWSTYADYIVGV